MKCIYYKHSSILKNKIKKKTERDYTRGLKKNERTDHPFYPFMWSSVNSFSQRLQELCKILFLCSRHVVVFACNGDFLKRSFESEEVRERKNIYILLTAQPRAFRHRELERRYSICCSNKGPGFDYIFYFSPCFI